ncbi:MAG: PEP-CTERM sorting domain-containing protein [Phycisphaerales bacterium]|nr:PEP-CTERM sorting domain-containing protein [Phycisphaerales bacterium]
MNAKVLICSVVGGMALAGAVSTVQAAWMAPSGGWQVNYEASSGVTPDDPSVGFTNVAYQHSDPNSGWYSAVVTDSITSEKTLLLDNSTSGGPNYKMTSSPGAGTYGDKVTLDFRFRLPDSTLTTAGWGFAVNRPGDVGNTTTHSFALNFGLGYVEDSNRTDPGRLTTVAIGTGWHDARFLVDVAANTGKLYLDGSSTAAVSISGTVYGGLYNFVWFGDAQSDVVLGKAEVSNFRWTNSELAAVPEPVSMGLLALGGSMLLMRRRRGTV